MPVKFLREPKLAREAKTYQGPILPKEIAILEYIVEGKGGSLFQQNGKPRIIVLRIRGRQLYGKDAQEIFVSYLCQFLELLLNLFEFLLS